MLRIIGFIILIGLNILLWATPLPHGVTVRFFDVGQGDSILIEGPTGVQVLVDGGPDSSAARELGRTLPFWDRTIDSMVITHPDQDHIGGLPAVLDRYAVLTILDPGVENDTTAWKTLLTAVASEVEDGASVMRARAGMRLVLGGGAYADVLYPDRIVTKVKNTNEGSVVLLVHYGKTAFMLTGDLPSAQEQSLFFKYGYGLHADVLKAGHHGSRTSSSADFVQSVGPTYAVFSRGCNNRYGHPHQEVLALFSRLNIKTLDTCTGGTISFSSDGKTLQWAQEKGAQ